MFKEDHNEMMDKLNYYETLLPVYLRDGLEWHEERVTKFSPSVDRLFRYSGGNEIQLQKMHPCDEANAHYHCHPCPTVVKILSGHCQMKLGYGECGKTGEVGRIYLKPGSIFTMTEPHSHHLICPCDGPIMVLTIKGPNWNGRSLPRETESGIDPSVKKEIMRYFLRRYPKKPR